MLQAPGAGIAAYCEAVDIPFIEEAMNWERRDENPTWNSDEHGFHDSLKASTGLERQQRSYPPLRSSADMMRLYEASRPHYDALYAQRMQIG